jgi:hypothetical protein
VRPLLGRHLGEDAVDHPVEEVVLVGDVLVERHGLHAELVTQLAHRQRVDAGPGRKGDGCCQDPVPAQPRSYVLVVT